MLTDDKIREIAHTMMDGGSFSNLSAAVELGRRVLLADAEEKRASCKHPNKREIGSARSDGYYRTMGHCPDCGKSWHHETPAQPQAPLDLSMQPRN